MPTGKKFDLIINQKGYMLSRATQLRGRAWSRTGAPDTPDKRSQAATTVGVLPPQIDYPEIFNDWSGGFGHPYRQTQNTNSLYAYQDNPNSYHWAENMDTRWPHQLVHAQQMQLLPARYASLNTNVLNLLDCPAPSLAPQLAGAGVVYVMTAGTPTGTGGRLYPTGLVAAGSAFDMGPLSAWTDGPGRPAIFGSYIYLSNINVSRQFFLRDTLDDSSVTTLGDHPIIDGWTTAGNRLWGYQGFINSGVANSRRIYTNSVAAGADPITAANWSATLNIGNAHHQINDLRAYKDQVFAGLEDGLYAGDTSGTFVNVLNDLAGRTDADNCRDIAIHNGSIIVQHVAGIYAYNPNITTTGQVREIGPNLLSNRSPIVGKFRALEAMGPWLYAGLWNGSQSYLMAGIDDNPPGPYTWHVLNRYPHVARPQRIHVDGITTSSGGLRVLPQRMWAATDPSIVTGGTAPLYVWPIPLMNGDPLSAQMAWSANYVGSARIDLGITDNRAPATPKLYRSVTIESENLGSPNRYADVYYTIDQGTRTLLGRAIDSPRSVLYFPSAQGSFSNGYSIELSLESFTATPAISPVYRSIVMRSTFRPNAVDLISAIIDVDDASQDREGSGMRPGATQLAELRTLARQGSPVTLIDLSGASSIVEVLAPVEEEEVSQSSDESPKIAAHIKLAVLQFSGPAT